MSSFEEIEPKAPDTAPVMPGDWNLVQLTQPRPDAHPQTARVQDTNPQVMRVSDTTTTAAASAPQSDSTNKDPTLDDLHKAVETQTRVGPYPIMDRDSVKAQVDKLTPEDRKSIGEIARAVKDHDFKKFDEILNKQSCSQDHIRDIVVGANLWMQQTGLGDKYTLVRGTSAQTTTETEKYINPSTGHELQITVDRGAVAIDILPANGPVNKPLHHFEADEPCG